MTSSKKTKMLVLNGIVAAMYLALSMITPFAQGPIQFRVSESLNHLVVFNKKLMWGVLGGVVLYNMLFSEFGWLDVVFGGGQSFLALGLTAIISKYVTDIKKRMIYNTIFFTISMFMIALMLHIAIEVPFWLTFGTTALSELVIMSISAPIMYLIGQQIDLT